MVEAVVATEEVVMEEVVVTVGVAVDKSRICEGTAALRRPMLCRFVLEYLGSQFWGRRCTSCANRNVVRRSSTLLESCTNASKAGAALRCRHAMHALRAHIQKEGVWFTQRGVRKVETVQGRCSFF